MQRVLRSALLPFAFGLLLLLSATSVAADKHKWGEVTPEEWAYQAPADYPHAPAVVLFDIGSIEVGKSEIRIERYQRFKIVNRHAAERLVNMDISVYAKDKFRGFEAQTLLADGTTIRVKNKDLLTKTSDPYEVHSFSYPGVEDGCIVELKYTVTSDRFERSLPDWQFQCDLFTRESRFSFCTYPGYTFNTVLIALSDSLSNPVVEEARLEGRAAKRFTWTVTDLPPIEREGLVGAVLNYCPSIYMQFASYTYFNELQFPFLTDWWDLKENFEASINWLLPADYILQPLTDSVSGTISSVEGQIAALHAFVRDQVTTDNPGTYHNFPTQSVQETVSRRAGTAADKNLLLVCLLRARQLIANPLIIATRDYALFNSQILNGRQFNYLLCHVQVDSTSYVLDTSYPEYPFPIIAPRLRAEAGLLLDRRHHGKFAYGSGGTRLPRPFRDTIKLVYPDWKSGIENRASLWLRADGSAVCTTHVKIAGYDQEALGDDTTRVLTLEILTDLLRGLRDHDVKIVESTRNPITTWDSTAYDVVLEISDFSSITGDLLSCTPALLWSGENSFPLGKRQFPIDFRYQSFYTETLDLHAPEGSLSATFPENAEIINRDLMFSRRVFNDGGSARLLSSVMVKKFFYLPDEYPQLHDFFEKCASQLSDYYTAKIK